MYVHIYVYIYLYKYVDIYIYIYIYIHIGYAFSYTYIIRMYVSRCNEKIDIQRQSPPNSMRAHPIPRLTLRRIPEAK